MENKEKMLNSKSIYQGKVIHVHVDDIELSDGTPAIREVVEHPGGCCHSLRTP